MAQVYILLPIHNRRQTTQIFVDCLLRQSFQNYHLVVIDDGSTDGSAEMIQKRVPQQKLSLLQGNGNLWWAGALQKGLDYLQTKGLSSEDILLIINDDVQFNENFLRIGKDYVSTNPDTLLLARIQDPASGLVYESGVEARPKKLQFCEADDPAKINCLSTRGLFLTWETCKRIGGFHPFLLPHYWSDYEYTMRAHRLGFSLRTIPDLYLVSDEQATGVRTLKNQGLFCGIRSVFSKRSVYNPFYRLSFFCFVLPWYYLPVYFLKEAYVTLRTLGGLMAFARRKRTHQANGKL